MNGTWLVAQALYDRTCPILLVDAATFDDLPPTLPATTAPKDTP